MAESKRTQKKADAAAQPPEFNAEDANVLDPQKPEGVNDPQAAAYAQEAQRYDLDDLRTRRNEAAQTGDAAATAHLDNLIREAEAAERAKDDAKHAA